MADLPNVIWTTTPEGVPVPIFSNPQDQAAYAQAQLETGKKLAATAASTAATNVWPDRALPGAYGWIPFAGAGEGLLGFVGQLAEAGRTIAQGVGKPLGIVKTNLPPVPEVLTKAGEHFQNTQEKLYSYIPGAPQMDYSNPDDVMISAVGQGVGAMAPIIPSAALTRLPSVLRVPLRHMLPTTEGAPVNVPISTAYGAAAGAQAISEAQAQDQQDQQQAQPSEGLPDDLKDSLGKLKVPFLQAPRTDSSSAAGAPQFDLSGVKFGDLTAAAPRPLFHEEGSSDVSWGHVALTVAGILAAIGAARFTHGLGVHITAAERDARLNAPDYAAKSADYNNAQIAAQAGTQISNAQGTRTTAPLPRDSALHSAAVAAQTQILDANALARDYARITSADPAAYERLANQYGRVFDLGRWQSTNREFLITGRDEATKITIPSPKKLFDDIGELPDPQKKMLIDGLSSANEMDNRNYNYGRGIIGKDAAHDFVDTPDQQLVAFTQQMLADPRLADIAHRFWGIGSGLIDIGEARGFFPPGEARRLKQIRPNYVPEVGTEGVITHALGPRQLAGVAGVHQVNTTPWSAMAQHIEALTRQFDIADVVRAYTDHQLDLQRTNPRSAQFLHEVPNPHGGQQPSLYPTLGPSGQPHRESIYSVRRPSGVKFYRSDSPEFYRMIKGQNANKMLTQLGILDRARRVVQLGTTGTASTLTGRAFPLTHVGRVTLLGAPINRPKGYAGSLSDALLQAGTRKLFGKAVGQRMIVDPTNILGAAYDVGRTGFDDLALRLSEGFDPKNANPITQALKSVIGPQQMQALSDSMRKYYLGTTTHEMAAMGVSGTGMPFRFRPPAGALGGEGLRSIRLQSAQLSPKLFMPPGKLTGKLGAAIKAHTINVLNALEEPYGGLMDSGNRYFYRLNKYFNPGIDRSNLAYETRALVGNPSTHGASPLVRGYTSLEQYSNIAGQALARRGRAFNEAPITMSASVVGHLGSLALLSIYTAMRNPQAMQYLENMITTQARAANVAIFGNDDPQYHTQISLPQELRPIYALILDLVSKAFNLTAVRHDPASFDGVYQFMKDWFSEHVENSTWESALHGASDALDFLDVPSWINAATAAAGGGSLRFNLEKLVNDLRNRNFGWNTFSVPLGTDNPLPNHPVGDHLFEGQDGKKWSVVMSSLFGTVGGILDDALGLARNYHHMHNFLDALGQTGQDWLQRAMDLNPSLNSLLWENPVRESMRSPIVEMTQRRLTNMSAAGGAKSAELMEGTTGGKFPLPVTPLQEEDKNAPPPGPMHDLYYIVKNNHDWIQSHYVAEINQIKKQMQDASQQPMDNKQRREWMNNQTRVISDKYRFINSYIDDKSQELSQLYGRRIDIGSPIDWKGTIDQFPPLN